MNKKSQGMILGVMLFVFVFVTAVILVSPIKDMTEIARDATHLDCDADNLTTGVATTCLIVDLFLPFFIGTVIFSAAGFLFIKNYGSV